MIRDRDPFERHDPFRLHVFVPAIMSAGLLFSLVTLARDVIAGRSRRGADRRAAIAAAAVVAEVVRVEPTPAERGLRPRRFYLMVALGAAAAGAYVVPAALLTYAHEGGYLSDEAWVLATALVVALLAVGAASVAGATWWHWPAPPGWARQTIAATPLGATPGSAGTIGGGPGDRRVLAAALAAGGAFVVLAAGVGATRSSFTGLDDWLVTRLRDLELPDAFEGLSELGNTEVAVALALLVGASTLRCRAFAAGWAAMVAGTFALDAVVKAIIERPRPLPGATGLDDSFPSGHVVQATLLAMAVPLALRVVSRHRWPGLMAGALLGSAAVVAGMERVEEGTHWPSDAVGGVLLAVTAGFTLRWIISHPGWHARCHDCPWNPAETPAHRPVRPLLLLPPAAARWLRLAAAAWLAAVVTALAILAANGGLPVDPEGEGTLSRVEEPGQLALLGLAMVGGLVAVRWPAAGATILAAAALGLGLLASVEYPEWVVIGVTVAVAVPAVLFWLAWQHVRSLHSVVSLAVVAAVLLAGEATAAHRVYDHFFGPAHPASATAGVPVDHVQWAWVGDLRTDGATVVARLDDHGGGQAVSLALTPLGGRERVEASATSDADGVVRLHVAGLAAATRFRWVIEVDGQGDRGRGRGSFATAPEGAASFTIAAGSCARTGSNGAVFDAIRAQDPLLYLATGDLHYSNLDATDPGPFLAAYGRALTTPAQAALYRQVPVDYVWDDHDYGPNDADASSPGRDAARTAYRQAGAHPPLPSEGAIFHASTIGRVRIVVTDTRSERTGRTMLGEEQLAWLLDELRHADRWGLVVWVNPDPWIAPADPARDDWGGFAGERQTIADAIADAGVDNLVMVSGDAHMVAIDDGTNSDYSTNGGAGFPVLHAAALDRPGNVKGGPYSEGAFPGAGQFGILRIDDDGAQVTVELEGRNWRGEVLVRHRFTAG